MDQLSKNLFTPIGITNFRNQERRFGIKQADRSSHMYIIGKTGTGKSTLIKNMAIDDIRSDRGLALIDPHGDLAGDILHFIPNQRMKDVIYFNPADTEHPIAFNPLERTDPAFRHLVASGLISVFKKIWPEFWGPRLEHILRYSVLTLLEYRGSTLLDIPKLLTNKKFRAGAVKLLKNQQLKDFWLLEFDKYSAWRRSEAISPILNKVGQFLSNPPLRNVVSQPESAFNLREVMDQGKILIVDLSKGKIGEDNCSLLGSLLVTKLWLAAMSRAELPEEKREPFHLYVDEAHNFITLSFADVLSESRKYGLNLILAHQYIEQFEEKIRAAIFGNVGTMISFRLGVNDAKVLAEEFHPVFSQNDLVSLPNYHIYLKLAVDGKTSQAFSGCSLPPLVDYKTQGNKDEVIRLSKTNFSTKKERT